MYLKPLDSITTQISTIKSEKYNTRPSYILVNDQSSFNKNTYNEKDDNKTVFIILYLVY